MMAKRKRIGEILIAEGLITEEQLKEALLFKEKKGGKTGEILVKLGYLNEEQIVTALSKQLNIPCISLASKKMRPAIDQNLEKLISHDFAVKHLVLPLSRRLNSLTVVAFDPLDLIILDDLKRLTGCEINIVISTKSDILKAIENFYGKDKLFRDAIEAAGIKKEAAEKESSDEIDLSLDELISQAEEAPVIKLVDLIIRQAIKENASDIHLEPREDKLLLRYRIDGMLYEMPSPAASLSLPIISRIKILSKMDIAEKRLPQDGGFSVKMGAKLIDLRISTLPTVNGEKIALRILDKSRIPLDLSKLGFFPQELEIVRKGISATNGLILLTGPTGSGKSTTLYATLNELKSTTKNILTVEDPVEYRIEGINQVQVKPEIGLTFANALRCFLRQDPDIILVGEIRDLETAEICVHASLTGHLVLSTLHTNDAASTITRLVDIGIPNYLIASSLRLVVAQRLVRELCPHCKQPYEVKEKELPRGVRLNVPVIYKVKGCEKCNFVGYKGRTSITEVVLVGEEIVDAIYKKLAPAQIMEIAKKKGSLTLLGSGLRRVEEGVTSLEEIFAVTVAS